MMVHTSFSGSLEATQSVRRTKVVILIYVRYKIIYEVKLLEATYELFDLS